MNHLLQPGPNLCGQTCIAIITNKSVEEVIKAIGKCGRTRTKDLIKGIRYFEFQCANRLRPVRRATFPHLCIAGLKFKKQKIHHWVVIKDRIVYDPLAYYFHLNPGEKISSYLTIWK